MKDRQNLNRGSPMRDFWARTLCMSDRSWIF